MNVDLVVRDYMRDPEGMVLVTDEPDSLYKKMVAGNIKVCADCQERKERFGKLFLVEGEWFRCPRAIPPREGISLCEDIFLPKDCSKKFEHGVAVRMD